MNNTPQSESERPYGLKDWEQIEDAEGIRAAIEEMQAATRFDVYTRAELYEAAYPGYPGDKDYYLEKGKTGKVLYLGAGAGRIFGELAKINPDAVGLDNSPEMLELLRKNHPEITDNQVLLADAASEEIPEQTFDQIIAPYSFLMVVPREVLPSVLQNIRRMLKPGGKFTTDSFSPFVIPFRKPGIETSKFTVNGDVPTQMYITYDHPNQRMRERTVFRTPEGNLMTDMHLEYYFPREVATYLHQAGLTLNEVTGDYSGEHFDPSKHDVVVYEAVRDANIS